MRAILTRLLKELGFETLEALHGKDAYDRLAAMGTVDVALVDWNMPEMSGIELLKTLRAEGNQIRMGFVTSESDPAMRDLAFQSGALFMITKPFSPDTLKSALAPVLG